MCTFDAIHATSLIPPSPARCSTYITLKTSRSDVCALQKHVDTMPSTIQMGPLSARILVGDAKTRRTYPHPCTGQTFIFHSTIRYLEWCPGDCSVKIPHAPILDDQTTIRAMSPALWTGKISGLRQPARTTRIAYHRSSHRPS